jgi:hypothetical protein
MNVSLVERPFVAGGPLGWELSPGVNAGALSRLEMRCTVPGIVIPRSSPQH